MRPTRYLLCRSVAAAIAGGRIAANAIKPDIEIVGSGPAYPSMFAIRAPGDDCAGDTIDEGIAVRRPEC